MKDNNSAAFDTGAAWMAMALQAHKMGLWCHAMAGFDADKAYEVTGVNRDDYAVLCAIAVGKQGPAAALPDELKKRETPSNRQPVTAFAFEQTTGDS